MISTKSSLKSFVTDSRALYYSDGLGGRSGNWVDGTARQGTGADPNDENHHLAKVRVAGSNPVFRSIVAGQKRFSSMLRFRDYPLKTTTSSSELANGFVDSVKLDTSAVQRDGSRSFEPFRPVLQSFHHRPE